MCEINCCKNGVCSIQDIKKFDDIQYAIKLKLCYLIEKRLKNLNYGYYCSEEVLGDINKLNIYYSFFEELKLAYSIRATSCMCDENIQKVFEKATKMVGKESCPAERYDLKVDESGLENYLLSNTGCAPYQSWSKFSNKICTIIGFNISVEKEKCDLTYDIVSNVITCELVYDITSYKEKCDLGYTVSSTVKDCKIGYDLVSKLKCKYNLTKKDYIKLVKEHNLDHGLIKKVYEGNLELVVLQNRVYLKSPTNLYPLFSMAVRDVKELNELRFKIESKNITKEINI